MADLDFWLEEKAVDADGTIEGVAAGYGNVDHGGDILMPGAMTKSLQGKSAVPMLLFHDQRQPVGVWTKFEDQARGLKVRGRFALKTQLGREAHAMAQDGALAGLSIGYRSLKEKFKGAARELHEIALHEVSLVAVPMNDRAQITGVKALELKGRLAAGDRLTEREFELLLKETMGLSNSEAERAVRLHFKGGGDPRETADPAEAARAFRAAFGLN